MSPSTQPSLSDQWGSLEDDDEGWEEMPVIREDENVLGLDEEDQKKYHYVEPKKKSQADSNATGNLIDFDDRGNEWRAKQDLDENEYTRLRLDDDDDGDEVHLRTKYLFDEDKAMTPLSQMQTTKNLLTETQRIAYVGLCALVCKEMVDALKAIGAKDKAFVKAIELWRLKIMGRVYYHMELETAEQKMIESLAEHGVNAMDLVPSLMTTHTIANPEYDPAEAKRKEAEDEAWKREHASQDDEDGQDLETPNDIPAQPSTPRPNDSLHPHQHFQTTANVMQPLTPTAMPGVSTSLNSTDKDVTLDIRWTILCDLFLILIADSVYDARSRVLLENVATKLGLGWLDVVKFEKRVTDALEIQEGIEKLEQKEVIDSRQKSAKKKRYVMMGLATLGGGLVIGLSAGLLAPVIGAGLGAAFTTIGITGTGGFLAGAGGAAVITTTGVLTGSSIGLKGMARRTRQVHTFDLLPLHNNKRVNCIITVPGFMNSAQDDVRLPFSVLDPVVGDVFSVLWEPEMMGETGNALKILTGEVLSQVSTTVLQATVMTGLMSAIQWPLILTKLGYLIDNPWSNALDRARAAGGVLADVLMQRHLGVRPITLMGFSLGARVIFYALLELAKQHAVGIVQDVFLFGATLTAPTRSWLDIRSVVSGRLVNCYAKNDWVLNYLFRATSGGLGTVAGLRPVLNVPGLENVEVTDKIQGHMSYRPFMPLILDQLGFPVTATFFDEPEDLDMAEERMIIREEEAAKEKKSRFSLFSKKSSSGPPERVSRPPGPSTFSSKSSLDKSRTSTSSADDDLPERMEKTHITDSKIPAQTPTTAPSASENNGTQDEKGEKPVAKTVPVHAGFDFKAIEQVLEREGGNHLDNQPTRVLPPVTIPHSPPVRPESAPLPLPQSPQSTTFTSHPIQSQPTTTVEAPPESPSTPTMPSTTRSLSMSNMADIHGPSAEPRTETRGMEPTVPFAPWTHKKNTWDPSEVSLANTSTWQPETSSIPQERSSSKSFDSSFSGGFGSNPSVSFSGADGSTSFGSTFASHTPVDSPLNRLTSQDDFGASTSSLSFGSLDGTVSMGSNIMPTLSFGSPDGSITSPSNKENDVWSPKAFGSQNQKGFFSSNPWDS